MKYRVTNNWLKPDGIPGNRRIIPAMDGDFQLGAGESDTFLLTPEVATALANMENIEVEAL